MSEVAKEARCLGLGPAATVFYYRELIAAIERSARVPRLLIAHADINRVYAAVTANDLDGLARYLAELIANMHRGGAELTAIVAATPHICAPQLVGLSPVPLVDMISEVERVVRARGLTRVALLGTRFTVESRMFGRLGDIEIVMPRPEEIERIHAIYTQVVAGHGSQEQLQDLRKLAGIFVKREGAQAVLITGTDLSPLLKTDDGEISMIDCAAVHIEAIVRRLID